MRGAEALRKQTNKQLILTMIRNESPIGRAQIARDTGLTIPSVMKITQDLIDIGLVREVGKGKSTGGKPPMLLEMITDSYYSIGVDLGANNIICVVMDAANIVAHATVPTEFKKGFAHVVDQIKLGIQNVLDKADLDPTRCIGIGVAAPGLLDISTGRIIFSPDIGWRDVDIIEPLGNHFGTYVVVENATRATAFGEKLFGHARGVNDYMCINLGYGIGGAVVFEGEVYSGFSGSAGEFGHLTVEPNGPLCDCGNHGCLEAVSSARAVVRDVRERLEAGEESALRGQIGDNLDKLNAKMVYDAAREGDALCLAVVEHAVEMIGAAIAGMINLLDFELIILEGGISRNGAFFTDMLDTAVHKHKMSYAGRNTKLVVSALGDKATAIGAASIVINQLLENSEQVVRLFQQ